MRKAMRTANHTTALICFLLGALNAQAQNQIQNPGFTSSLSPWTISSGTNYTVAWDGTMGNTAAGSASINMTTSTGATDAPGFSVSQALASERGAQACVVSGEGLDVRHVEERSIQVVAPPVIATLKTSALSLAHSNRSGAMATDI